MGRYLLLIFVGLLAFPAGAASMDLEEMMNMPGAELLTLRADEVVERLGPPAAIRDHGAKDLPRRQIRLGREQAALSDEPWNLIYGEFPARQSFEWVNPRPAAPRELEGLDTLVVYTHPDPEVLDFNEQTGKFFMRRAADELEGHAIYGIATIPTRSIPWEEFIGKWGPPDEDTVDEKMQPVSRYWVPLELEEIPLALFAVDVLRGPRGDVLSVAIYNSRTGFVADRLRQMWEEKAPEETEPEPAPPGELGPPEIKAAPGLNA